MTLTLINFLQKRNVFLRLTLLLFVALLCFELQAGEETKIGNQELKPNIVFCMADDWSWPHAGILGDPVVKTPNFDRVAREGILFEHAFVSTPSCTPSRLSILTGQHHWRLKEGDSISATSGRRAVRS